MQSYVTKGLKIPTLQKDKHIHEIIEASSPKKDTTILIAYFKDTSNVRVVGSILEIVTKNNKIPHINQIYDGLIPL